jgi:uncharacterized protein YkuJ
MPAPTPPNVHLPASAPGTPWSATGTPAQNPVPPVPLQPTTPPKKSRGPLWALVAVVAILAIGAGAFFAFAAGSSGGDDSTIEVTGPDGSPADAFSFARATTTASEAQAARFDMTMSIPLIGEMVIDGAMDSGSQRMSMSMSIPALDESNGSDGLFPGQDIEMVLDGEALVMYMKDSSGFLGSGNGNGDSVWVSMDLSEMAEIDGLSVDEFQDSFLTNPAEMAAMFDGVDAVEVGMETIDGVEVMRYEVTVSVKDMIESNPQMADQFETNGFEVSEVEMFDQIAYDVWVTQDNQLRRMAFDLEIEGMQMSMVMNISEVSDSIDIPLPDPTDVESLDNIWGDLGAFED